MTLYVFLLKMVLVSDYLSQDNVAEFIKSSCVGMAEADERTNRVLVPLSMSTVAAARYILDAPVEKVLSVLLSGEVITELERFGETYAVHHLEKRLSSLDFYRDVTRGTGSHQVFHPVTQPKPTDQ